MRMPLQGGYRSAIRRYVRWRTERGGGAADNEQTMKIDIQQLAMQIYVQTVSPGIMDRVVQGSSLDKLFKGAAKNSLAAAEEFARACEETTEAPLAADLRVTSP